MEWQVKRFDTRYFPVPLALGVAAVLLIPCLASTRPPNRPWRERLSNWDYGGPCLLDHSCCRHNVVYYAEWREVKTPMPTPHPPYRVGIAGAGAFAAFLAGALAPLPEFELAAVAGRTDEKRQSVISAYRLHRSEAGRPREFREASQLIEDPDIDVVILTTPPHLHAPLGELALKRGKHLLVEKPGALNATALENLARLAKKQRRAFAVNLVLRYNPLVEAAEKIIRHRLLGRVYHASLRNSAHRVASGHWFWDRERSGGLFIEHGVHFFEVGRHWFGDAVEAQGFALTEANGESSRMWASVLHRDRTGRDDLQEGQNTRQETGAPSPHEYIPVHYYHGFVMDSDAPESTQWDVYCAQGRIVLDGWIPQRLYIEGTLTAGQADWIDALLDAVPTQPSAEAVEKVRAAAASISASGHSKHLSAGRRPYRRTLELTDRQSWYEAMAQARFLEVCRMIQDPDWSGLVTPADAVADLALAEACTASTGRCEE